MSVQSVPLLVDTDVMVDYLRGVSMAEAFLLRYADRLTISSIVVAELYAGTKENQEDLDNIISGFTVIPVTAPIARLGGLLRQKYGPSHGVSLPDALVAATAEVHNAELATRNVRHYPMIKGLRAAYNLPRK